MKNLEEKLDRIFSEYIRLRRADHAGYVACFTCGARLHWRQMDCGHWKGRGSRSTRWEEDNCRPQCILCNRLGGHFRAFEEGLRDELGANRVARLEKLALTPTKHTDPDIQAKIAHYEKLVRKMGKP